MIGCVFLSYLLFGWGVLHRVLLVAVWCRVLYWSGLLGGSAHYLIFPRVRSSLVVSGPGVSVPSPKAHGLISSLLLLAAPHFIWKEHKSGSLTSGLGHPPSVQHSDVLLCKSSGISLLLGSLWRAMVPAKIKAVILEDRPGAGIGNPQPRGLWTASQSQGVSTGWGWRASRWSKGPHNCRFSLGVRHICLRSWCFWTVVLEKTLGLQGDPSSPS